MPFDSQGNFTRLHSWEQDRIDDIDIVTDHHDAEDDNFADGFNQCFLRSGVVPMKGNLNAGGFKVTRVKEATDDTDAVNLSQVETKVEELKTEITKTINDSLMIGDIKCSALQKDHGNWMICNGRALSREDYADLFEAIGETFGDGNGITTFNLPDCRGVAVRGYDNGRGYDSGRKFGSYQADQMQTHTHGVPGVQSFCSGGGPQHRRLLCERRVGFGGFQDFEQRFGTDRQRNADEKHCAQLFYQSKGGLGYGRVYDTKRNCRPAGGQFRYSVAIPECRRKSDQYSGLANKNVGL